jgi:hypothetical protein
VRLASGGHVSCEDGYDPADFGHGAGLEEEQAADEFLLLAEEVWIGSGRNVLERCQDLVELTGARCFGWVAVCHVVSCEEFVDV